MYNPVSTEVPEPDQDVLRGSGSGFTKLVKIYLFFS
jgi:hypothetical protein